LDQLPGLQYTPLFEDQYSVVCAKDHALAQKRQVRWEDLRAHQIIGFSSDTGMQAQLMRENDVPECVRKPHYQVSNTATIYDLVQQGLGVSIMPAVAAKREPLDKLLCLPLVHPVLKRQMCLIQRSQRSLTPAASALLNLLLQELPKLKANRHFRLLFVHSHLRSKA
jgi:DNA-binding transcriptional LysR family regulator